MKKIALLILSGFALVSCDNTEPKPVDHHAEMGARVDSLAAIVMSNDSVIDVQLAENLEHAYKDFNKAFPEDSMVVWNTFNLGVLYSGLPGKEYFAIEQFAIVYDDYREHPLAPQALYNMGIMFDTRNDKEKAALTFHEFVNQYPEHDWAEAARAMVELNADSVDLEAQVDQWLQQAQ